MYGPVRTVVWQGSAGNRRPYADLTPLPEMTTRFGFARFRKPRPIVDYFCSLIGFPAGENWVFDRSADPEGKRQLPVL